MTGVRHPKFKVVITAAMDSHVRYRFAHHIDVSRMYSGNHAAYVHAFLRPEAEQAAKLICDPQLILAHVPFPDTGLGRVCGIFETSLVVTQFGITRPQLLRQLRCAHHVGTQFICHCHHDRQKWHADQIGDLNQAGMHQGGTRGGYQHKYCDATADDRGTATLDVIAATPQ